jgi:hypothetical protein
MVSRQYKWQLKKRAQGLCVICGQPTFTKWHCREHAISQRERRRTAQNSKPWERGKAGRPPLESYRFE